jgi:hypothetical protein
MSRSLKEENRNSGLRENPVAVSFFPSQTRPPRLKAGDWQTEKWYSRILAHVKNNKDYRVYRKVMSKYTFTGLDMRELNTHCTEKSYMFKLT